MTAIDKRGKRLDQKWTQGDPFEWRITLTSEDTPVDITGYTFAGALARTPGGTVAATMTATLTDATNGIVTLTMTPAVTGALNGVYAYDVQYTDDSANGPYTIYYGQIEYRVDVTT